MIRNGMEEVNHLSNFPFWQRWLFVVGIGIVIFGLLMAVISGSPVFGLFNRQIDPALWGTVPSIESIQHFQSWIYGVWGATIAGLGVFLSFIAHDPFRNKEKWARNCLIIGLLVWFVLNTSLSLFYKVYFNAAFNTALFILAGLPLFFTRNEFT
jgi:uncharacterized membrane protein YiaA